MSETTLTDAEFVVLSLICDDPQHGYQIEQLITSSKLWIGTDLSKSSIYFVLRKMHEKGWIELISSAADQTDRNPRKIYQATPEGVLARQKATRNALERPRAAQTNFLLGLNSLTAIPAADSLEAVRTYLAWLETDLQQRLDHYQNQGESDFSLDVLFEYGFILGGAELAFLADLISRLEQRARES